MRKILTFLFAALMSVGMFALTPQTGDEWDNTTKTLTVNSDPGYAAYYEKTEIQHVIFNSGVTSIGAYAFNGCSGLTSVTIPNSVTSIGQYAFYECSNLTSLTIGNSVESIGQSAFRKCSGLTSVTIPNSVTSIGDYAFRACSGLTSVTIPNSVTSIGNQVFDECPGLTSPIYNDHVFAYLPTSYSGTTYTIPDGIESIAGSAFRGCTGLTSIEIPNTVTSLGTCAFYGCTGLTSVTIPNSVTSIGHSAFYWCSGLTSIEIPNSVTSIAVSAFANCLNLKTVTILAESLNSYGGGAFNGTHANLKIYVPAGSVATYKTGWSAYQDRIFAIGAFFDITANEDPDNAGVYYSTFYHSSKKYELPEGVEAYVAALSGDALTLTKIAEAGQTIPADNAVILKSTVNEFSLSLSEADAVTFSATNSLQGTDDAITNPNYGRVYVLSAEGGAVGFYKLSSGATIPAHKAYVTIPSAGAPKRLRFVFEQENTATGVDQITNNQSPMTNKVLRDGQLIIIRNSVEYNANGQIVK